MIDPNDMTHEELVEVVQEAQKLIEKISTYILYTGAYLDEDGAFQELYEKLNAGGL